MPEKDEDISDGEAGGNGNSTGPETSPEEVIQRLGLVNRAASEAVTVVKPTETTTGAQVEPFIRPELDEPTTVDLLAKCAELFPEKSDKLPSFTGLKALVTRLVNGWESVLELNKKLSNRRYDSGERNTLVSAAESIGDPEYIAELFNNVHEIYVRILSLAPLFKSKDFGDLINKDDFSLNHDSMARIADVVTELLISYENLRIQANTHSNTIAQRIKNREMGHPGDSLDADKSVLMRAHRWNKLIVDLQAKGIFKAMKNGDIQGATTNLATAIETTFFVASEYLGMAFAPQISKDDSGKLAFEKYSPFKADYLMYLMTTLFELLPALRVQMHIFSRIQKWNPAMAELDVQKSQSDKPKLN